MAGYNGTTATPLNVAIGSQTFQTQAALAYLPGETIQLTFIANPAIFMIGTVTAYNPVTGSMTVNFTQVFGFTFALQPPWNTLPWGSTEAILEGFSLSLIGGVPATTVSVVPTIIVRRLDSNWDPVRGNGLQNFLTDNAAVAQIIAQRIKLLQGEWFENTSLGLPLFQSILGQGNTNRGVLMILRKQILAAPFVTAIESFSISYGPAGRMYVYAARVSTAFGTVVVGNVPPTVQN